jgi:DNA-binding GntR family transcriptional regulator
MLNNGGSPTQMERVLAELRGDILAGRQLPGTKLAFADLTARYSASQGVIREVLARLTAQGLVESRPQHGFRVMPLSVPDLENLTEARCLVEPTVLRQSIQHGGVSWESEVLAAHYRLEQTPQQAPGDAGRITEEWAAAHAEYHQALLSASPNRRLLAIAESLRESAELYRRWSVPLGLEERDIAGEHRRILRALLDHDADTAAEFLTAHIQHTTNVLLEQGNWSAAIRPQSLSEPGPEILSQ